MFHPAAARVTPMEKEDLEVSRNSLGAKHCMKQFISNKCLLKHTCTFLLYSGINLKYRAGIPLRSLGKVIGNPSNQQREVYFKL